MCDSPLFRSALHQSASLSECSHSGSNNFASECSLRTLQPPGVDLSLEERDYANDVASPGSCTRRNRSYPYRFQLERDVQKLQEQLKEEMELHAVLERALEKTAVELTIPSCLPHQAQELLSNIAVLEVAVSKLENEMVSLHFQLSQERNERRLAEYRLRHSSSELKSLCIPNNLGKLELVDQPSDSTGEFCSVHSEIQQDSADLSASFTESISRRMDQREEELRKGPKEMPLKGLWDYPNKLSEEMVRCMKNIFISLADSALPCQSSTSQTGQISPISPHGLLSNSNSSWWSSSDRSFISSWVQSPQVDVQSNLEVLALENACDPYRVRGKLSWADVGNYGLVTEVSWMSVGKKQLEYAAGALRRFRTLVEQLAKVNPIHLNNNEKLAFWINLYNAMIMHAYLAYGVPRSDLKLFSLMQKAAYTVGGHSFNAAAIEYGILKMKPPMHRPQIALLLALHKLKISEEQRKSAIDGYEPLIAFALSCGMYSCPAVRIYTAKNVREELLEAQLDFIRASVGVSSKGRLLVPKMLHCFAKSFVDDAKLAVWISHYLPPRQAAFVEQCMSQRRQSLLGGSRNCGILPFDSRFRYLFLPGKVPVP
ncbi:uncharacterized protein LOC116198816 isoform X3 [Punica granatum]|uniref:Uncharacterized protein LOC116198816 isoform X3 n=2 Tax=Punica granatum TaxID=22663 RepID=A0A6P8CN38_PUNGR|nr:uncharacterized protein LOC116198816 isoform X3 [Punica granatum]XP_031384924.1 uncharacterized protein LOC116198816 isoform X3 [Punica granatum]XP_031384925.1 uncharacterized protein LOC116198816 isoform X3 [Punica granatum]XP_031384926.1 uncharacterized protein LOC116198816 isoform X3 [Punica granatum]